MTATNSPKDMGEVLRQMGERIKRLEAQVVNGYDTGWLAAPLVNGWVDYDPGWSSAAYRKKNGIVYCKGLIKNGGGLTSNIMTLPAGFRPQALSMLLVGNSGGITRVDIQSTGLVVAVEQKAGIFGSSWLSLFEISYPSDN